MIKLSIKNQTPNHPKTEASQRKIQTKLETKQKQNNTQHNQPNPTQNRPDPARSIMQMASIKKHTVEFSKNTRAPLLTSNRGENLGRRFSPSRAEDLSLRRTVLGCDPILAHNARFRDVIAVTLASRFPPSGVRPLGRATR